jgi:hypothetical protein
MLITPDGYIFTVYIEGVRFPTRSIDLTISKFMNQATLQVFPHPTISQLKELALVSIFYSKIGLPGEKKLLFTGYVGSKEYRRDPRTDMFVIRCFSRSRHWAHVLVASTEALSNGATAAILYDAGSKDPAFIRAQAAAIGKLDFLANDRGGESDNSSEDRVTQEKKVNPSSYVAALSGISTATHSWLKIFMDYALKSCYTTSSIFNDDLYNKRMLYANYLAELPGGWTEEFYGTDQSHMQEYIKASIAQELKKVGGEAKLFDVLMLFLGLNYFDAYEIPGLYHGSFLLYPNVISTDPPICNVLWPSGYVGVATSEDDNARVTRMVITVPPQGTQQLKYYQELGWVSSAGPGQGTMVSLSMYPDAYKSMTSMKEGTEAAKYQKFLFKGEEYCGPRTVFHHLPVSNLAQMSKPYLKDFAKLTYQNMKAIHRACRVDAHFSPWLVPGFQGIVNDPIWPIIGLVAGIQHSIQDQAPPTTSVTLQYAQHLDDYEAFNASFYHKSWEPKQVGDNIYKAYLGCQSVINASGVNTESTKEALAAITERYRVNSNQANFIEVMSQRSFDNEATVFALQGAKAAKQDNNGVVTYEGDVFANVQYDGYDHDLSPLELVSKRRTVIQDYINEMYGSTGIKI